MATDNLRQLEALMSRLDQDRAALQQPTDVSRRTPNTISTDSNAADKIERHLRADGHRTWGFVVYRCTYSSDAAWESCIQRINASIQKSMDRYNGSDLFQEGCFKLTVIDDASMLDGASTQAVRRHFRQWCAPAIEGCTDEDVGWMNVQLVGLMMDFYANVRDPNLWHVQYIRPPDIATA